MWPVPHHINFHPWCEKVRMLRSCVVRGVGSRRSRRSRMMRKEVTSTSRRSNSWLGWALLRARVQTCVIALLTTSLTASRSTMGSNKVSVNNHLKISATPSLATLIFKESAQTGKPEDRTGLSQWLKSKWLRAVETTVLTCVILFVCGLFTIPTILYAAPPLQVRYWNFSTSCKHVKCSR